jgi:uncharacterized protein YkwD
MISLFVRFFGILLHEKGSRMISKRLTVSMNNLKRCAFILVCTALVGCAVLDKSIEGEATSTELVQLEQRVHQLINQYRISKNLPPLTTNEIITKQARIHSRAMAKKRVTLGHDGFGKRVERISRFLPYSVAAENVAYNKGYSDCAQQTVQSWLESPKHRKNIRGNYRLTGIGVAKNPRGAYYFTQILWQ